MMVSHGFSVVIFYVPLRLSCRCREIPTLVDLRGLGRAETKGRCQARWMRRSSKCFCEVAVHDIAVCRRRGHRSLDAGGQNNVLDHESGKHTASNCHPLPSQPRARVLRPLAANLDGAQRSRPSTFDCQRLTRRVRLGVSTQSWPTSSSSTSCGTAGM